MFRSELMLSFSLLIMVLTTVESKCPKTCDLALGSYYFWPNASIWLIHLISGNSMEEITSYNPGSTYGDGTRINFPFKCDCIDDEFLGHVFTYAVQESRPFFDEVAKWDYANLTTAAMLAHDNIMSYAYALLNVTVNCSCGDASVSKAYGLFITYPLRAEDNLQSIAAAANLSEGLLQRYNPGVDFSAGSGLVYIPGRDKSGHYPPLNSSTGLSGGVIAGISVGAVIGALLVVVAVSILFYKKKKVKDKTRYEDLLPLQAGINVDKSVEFSREELAKATNDFNIDRKIGQGGFGSVYYAELRGKKAAIKKMDMQATKEFLAELKVLTSVNHLNLVRLIGYCVEGSLFLVYEYIENGNLSQHLRGTGWDPLPWSTRVQIALDSARGLEYIHEHTLCVYIHRDIKSANILIDKNFRAKVADFGLTKLVEAGGLSLPTRLVGTFGYMAPEYTQYGDVSPKLDVYAFGVVLYELISAKKAIVKADDSTTEWKGLIALFEEALDKPDPREGLCKLVDPRLGDNYPLDSVCKMAELARACTQANPRPRPSMRSAVVALMSLSSSTEDWDVGASYENQALASLSQSDSLECSDQTVEDFQR